jgi:nitrogen fixation/metabolism regulation signal transduction histidine kinase
MNKFVTERGKLLDMFSNATRDVDPEITKSDIEPILNKALNNFKNEMRMPIEDFANETKLSNFDKTQIFQILIKHFCMSLMNEKLFMDSNNVSEITYRIEHLLG